MSADETNVTPTTAEAPVAAAPVAETPSTEPAKAAGRTARRTVQGVVKSNKMQKTILVTVMREFKHPKYEKRVRRTKHYVVHDENGEARPGDVVEMMETRKLSKTKNWRLVRIVKRAE